MIVLHWRRTNSFVDYGNIFWTISILVICRHKWQAGSCGWITLVLLRSDQSSLSFRLLSLYIKFFKSDICYWKTQNGNMSLLTTQAHPRTNLPGSYILPYQKEPGRTSCSSQVVLSFCSLSLPFLSHLTSLTQSDLDGRSCCIQSEKAYNKVKCRDNAICWT